MTVTPDFFEAARRSLHMVQLSDGSQVEMPLRTYRAEMFQAFFAISAQRARALLPSDHLRPVRISPRRAVLGIQVMEYGDKSIAPYREFVTSLMVHRSRAADVPGFAAVAMERLPGAGAYLTHIAVTTEESRRVGWEVLGFPKFLCQVELTESPDQRRAKVEHEGQTIFSLAVRRPSRYRPRRGAFRSYSLGPDDNLLYDVPYQYRGEVGFRFGPRSAGLRLGDHVVAQEIRDLDLSPNPLMATHVRQFALVSNPPAEKVPVGDWCDQRGLYREVRARRDAAAGRRSRGPA